jgi:predicted ATPase
MLHRLFLTNFKAWKKLDIQFGAVTGLFGTNSSGKSSLLQFLLLMKQTRNATDRGIALDFGGADQLVNLGSFRDLIHGHDEKATLSWRMKWDLPNRLTINDPTKKRTETLASSTTLTQASQVQLNGKTLTANRLEYNFNGFRFITEPKKSGGTEYSLSALVPEGAGEFKFVRTQSRVWALPGPVKTYLFPDQAKTYFKNADFLSEFEAEYESFMDSIFYLGPLREYPRREYQWSGSPPSDVGRRGEKAIEAILSATQREEKRNFGGRTRYKPFDEMIAYWLKELGLIYEFKVEEIGANSNLYRTKVKRDEKSPYALLTDVGFGVSQVLPALVLLYYVPEGSIVLMEQPEIHLHPSVQSGLADVILNVAKTRNLQIIVESHSEHMLRRLQRRVAEAEAGPEQIKLYFCDSRGGESKLLDLELDVFGEVRNWPPNFFGDEMGEIAAMRKAVLRRKIAAEKQ